MNKDYKDALATLAKLRQGALMLSLANQYLCEPPFLMRISRQMERALQELPAQVKSLKSRFPGKFLKEVHTGPLVEDLHRKVVMLRNGEAETKTRCSQGELGRELELGIEKLSAAVNTIAAQVEGEPVPHSSGRGSKFFGLQRSLTAILLLLAVMGALLFGYLFFIRS